MLDMYDTLILGCGRKDGKLGIEIEVEGLNLPRPARKEFNKFWVIEHDGSLKGADNAEYVSKGALPRDGVVRALQLLNDEYVLNNSRVDESIRAGIHVHLNVQDKTPLELMTFLTTYFIMENYFVHWCGKGRVGNHFCLRAEDAEFLVNQLVKVGQTKDWRHVNTEDVRYSAMNLLSLFKYGSVEFRSMQGTRNLDKVLTWVDLILQLERGAKQFKNPREVIQGLSDFNGPENFSRFVMGDMFKEFEKFDVDIIKSMRYIQPLAFLVDWEAFTKEKINPFL